MPLPNLNLKPTGATLTPASHAVSSRDGPSSYREKVHEKIQNSPRNNQSSTYDYKGRIDLSLSREDSFYRPVSRNGMRPRQPTMSSLGPNVSPNSRSSFDTTQQPQVRPRTSRNIIIYNQSYVPSTDDQQNNSNNNDVDDNNDVIIQPNNGRHHTGNRRTASRDRLLNTANTEPLSNNNRQNHVNNNNYNMNDNDYFKSVLRRNNNKQTQQRNGTNGAGNVIDHFRATPGQNDFNEDTSKSMNTFNLDISPRRSNDPLTNSYRNISVDSTPTTPRLAPVPKPRKRDSLLFNADYENTNTINDSTGKRNLARPITPRLSYLASPRIVQANDSYQNNNNNNNDQFINSSVYSNSENFDAFGGGGGGGRSSSNASRRTSFSNNLENKRVELTQQYIKYQTQKSPVINKKKDTPSALDYSRSSANGLYNTSRPNSFDDN